MIRSGDTLVINRARHGTQPLVADVQGATVTLREQHTGNPMVAGPVASVLKLMSYGRAPITLAAALLLAGCQVARHPIVTTKPVPIEKPVLVVKPVPDALTAPHDIPQGRLAMCPDIAKQAQAELAKCNADKAAIRERHGERDDG